MLEKISDIVTKSLANDPISALISLVVLAGLFRIGTILTFARDWGRQKERDIKEALGSAEIGPVEKALLTQELNRLVIKRGLGFSASPAMRRAIAELIDRSEGELEAKTFARARQFISHHQGTLTVHIGTFGYIEYATYWIISIFFTIAAAATFATGRAVVGPLGLPQALGLLALEISLILIAALFLYGTLQVSAARKLKPILSRLQHAPARRGGEQ